MWQLQAMKFDDLLEDVAGEPLFETDRLLTGGRDPGNVRRQLSRWTRAGKVQQLRRGLYVLAEPFRRVRPHPFLVANHLSQGSFVSLETALAYYGLIEEGGNEVRSVGPGRPGRWQTPLGDFELRHVSAPLLRGYEEVEVEPGQRVRVARPEKALLDIVHVVPGGDEPAFLRGLGLRNAVALDAVSLDAVSLDAVSLDAVSLDLGALAALAEEIGKPKLRRAVHSVARLVRTARGPSWSP